MRREMVYVYEVYKEKSFTKAAEKLFISQPALSAMVKKAEQEIHAPIFDRTTNPVSLTQAGKDYIFFVEKIMAIHKEMEEHFSMNAKEASYELRFGGTSFFCSYILPPVVKGFQKLYPNVRVLWTEGKNIELANKLQKGELDFFLEVDKIKKKGMDSFLWGKEQIILAVPVLFPINQKLKDYAFTAEDIHDRKHLENYIPAVRMEVFSDQEFIFLREGNDSYSRGIQICKNAGFAPKIAFTVDSLMTAYFLAAEEHGITFIRDSILFYADLTDKLFFYVIDDPLAERSIHLYSRKSQDRTPTASAFLKYLEIEKRR